MPITTKRREIAIVVHHGGRLAFRRCTTDDRGQETLYDAYEDTIGILPPEAVPAEIVVETEPQPPSDLLPPNRQRPDDGRRRIAYAETIPYVGRVWVILGGLPVVGGSLMLHANGCGWKVRDLLVLETVEEAT